MFTVNDIKAEYARLDSKLNVDTSNIEIKISTQAINRLGSCRSRNGIPIRITITDFVLKDNDLFYDVIRHEYAHALTKLRYPKEKHGHDYIWQGVCREVGCNPSRVNEIESDVIGQVQENKKKYIVTCESCGSESKYYRKSNIVKYLENGQNGRYYCNRCNNKSFRLDYAV